MSINSLATSSRPAQTVSGVIGLELFNKNTMTTAGVCLGLGTGVASFALVSAALPLQMASLTSLSAGLIYIGDRQVKGLNISPFSGQNNADKSIEVDEVAD